MNAEDSRIEDVSTRSLKALREQLEGPLAKGSLSYEELDGLLASLDEARFEVQLAAVVELLDDIPLVHVPGSFPGPRARGLPCGGHISRRYLREVEKYETMAREDECAFAKRMEFVTTRSAAAEGRAERTVEARRAEYERVRAEFVERSLHIVVSHSYAYRTYGVPLDDLIQEGNAALMRAVEKFDWRHGVRFRTYVAYWIRQAIERHLATLKGAVRVPHHLQQKFRRLKREGKLPTDAEREPTVNDIAKAFEVGRDAAGHLLEASRPSFSIDQEITREGDTYRDFLIEDWEPVDGDRQHSLRSRIKHLFNQLDEREKRVLKMRFGLEGHREGCTLEEVGKALHLSRERSRQIQQRALSKLRHSSECGRLEEYL